MILIIGGSNYRNTLDKYGEVLSAAVKEKINLVQFSTNETLKVHLEQANNYKIIVVAAPINEIVQRVKSGKKKGRDETIKTVMEEQNKLVNLSAKTDGRLGVIHLLMPPFIRLEPAWMEDRTRLATHYMRDYISEKSPWNVGIGNPVDITSDDLGSDKVHLNEAGMEKLFKSLEKDLKKCKENLCEGEDVPLSQDWASQVQDELVKEAPTPGTIRKRKIDESQESDSEEEEVVQKIKKPKKNSAEDKMDKMFELMKEIKEDNKAAKTSLVEMKDKCLATDKKVDDLRGEFESLKGEYGRDNDLTAEMREDICGLENENLRSTVIVRKLKAEKKVPKDKKELRTYIQDLSRSLVAKVLGGRNSANSVKYAAMLYAFVDPTKKDNKEGLVPPFKICFNLKDQAVAFREKAVKLAKVGMPKRTFGADQETEMDQDWDEEAATAATAETNVCQGAYFTFYQTAATRFHVTLMWAVADAMKTKTKQVWVSQGNRPTLQVKEGGKVTKTLTFVQTMKEYKEKITPKTLEEVKKAASKLFAGKLEQTFIVIKD